MSGASSKGKFSGGLALQGVSGKPKRHSSNSVIKHFGKPVAKTAGARLSGHPAGGNSVNSRIKKVLSHDVDLDIAQISSRALVAPSRVQQVLHALTKKGVVEEIDLGDGDNARYRLVIATQPKR